MLHSVEDLQHYAIRASDGEIGHLRDVFFDEASWAIRYLVVETGAWLPRRRVLVSPTAVGQLTLGQNILPVALTLEQVRNGPTTYTGQLVPRQGRIGFRGFPGYPYKTAGPGSWTDDTDRRPATNASAFFIARAPSLHHNRQGGNVRGAPGKERRGNLQLHSCNAVLNGTVRAHDGEIGSVQGMLVDEEKWLVRYFIVKAGAWWPGHELLFAPPWIQIVDWSDSSILVDLTRKQVQESPAYDPEKAFSRQNESSLYAHYGRRSYWADEARSAPLLAGN